MRFRALGGSARWGRGSRALGPGLAFAFAFAFACPRSAGAGGLYFSDRGVRPMGRAGAFVAGADDLGAIWYNPAGLVDAGSSALVDFSYLRFHTEYRRELYVVDAQSNYQRFTSPAVSGDAPVLPIPTLGLSHAFGGRHQWTVAGGILAPYVALPAFDATVNGAPSPARYALGSYAGSIMAIPGAWIACKATEELRFGLGVMALVGVFQTTVTFSASPQDRLLGAPEQPEYDANAQMKIGPIFAPSMNGGVTWVPTRLLRFGLSAQLPTVISAPAKLTMQMPTSAVFDGAKQNGTSAHVRFVLPAVLRLGAELRPIPTLRVEIAYVREIWSAHQAIDITPEQMSIDGVIGMPPQVKIPPIAFPRGFRDSNSIRLGGEYMTRYENVPIALRAGLGYESSAVPQEYMSLASLDFAKVNVTTGAGVHVAKDWRLDLLYAHVFATSVYNDPATAKIPRVNPIKGNAPLEPSNGGTYSANADLIGIGVEHKF